MKRTPCFILTALAALYTLTLLTPGAFAGDTDPRSLLAGPDSGLKWAFCVGIGGYEDPRITRIPGAANDARALAGALERHGAFDRVMLLTDDLSREDPLYPTLRNLRNLLSRSLKEIGPGDLVLFGFSGHGITGPSGRSLLACADTRISRIEQTGLSLEEVLSFIGKTGVKRSLVFLDAAREEIWKGGDGYLDGVFPDRYMQDGATAVFYGARKGTHSYDSGGSEGGVFFRNITRGLEGEADTTYGGNGDGVVSLRELGGYLNQETALWSAKSGKRQIPWVKIMERGMDSMAVSSVEPLEPSRPVLAEAAPPREEAPPETREIEKAAEDPVQGGESAAAPEAAAGQGPEEKEEAGPQATQKETPESQPGPGGGEKIAAAAPAPPRDEITEERPPEATLGEAPGEEPEALPEEAAKAPQVGSETVEGKKSEAEAPAREPAAEERPTPPQATGERPPEAPIEAEESQAAGDESPKEDESAVEAAPADQQAGSAPEEEEPLKEAPPPAKPEIETLTLRKAARALTPGDVRALLYAHEFYATCWNYNSDFCNPEGDFNNLFEDNGDGTVTDRATGLMWQKGGSPAPVTWAGAAVYAEKINREGLGGHRDWRLPTLEELASLMERSWKNADLFIDPVFDRAQRYCWSLDTRDGDRAWKANFHMGFFLDFPMVARNSVRLVRSIP